MTELTEVQFNKLAEGFYNEMTDTEGQYETSIYALNWRVMTRKALEHAGIGVLPG